MNKVILTLVAVLLLGALGATVFVESGFYDIGADDHHTKAALALITRLRDRSIEARLALSASAESLARGDSRVAALSRGNY